jgi:microcystin degradation protein MlrC
VESYQTAHLSRGRRTFRVAVAELKQETNTFSPLPSNLESFEREGYLLRGHEVLRRLAGTNTEIGGFLQAAQRCGFHVVPLMAAWALSGGLLDVVSWQHIRNELIAGFHAEGPFDGVFLALHGALVADGCDDAEGTLLTEIRQVIGGKAPLVCTLDLHANLTVAMTRAASAIVPYHTNPHVDLAECGKRACDILQRLLAEPQPTCCRMVKLPMVTPPENAATNTAPMKLLMDLVRRIENDPEVLSAGVFTVQPWLDVDEFGNAVLVVAMGDRREQISSDYCHWLADEFWTRRGEFLPELFEIPAAIEFARNRPGLCVFSDSADSTSSGAPGDATAVLRELLTAKLSRPTYLTVYDPQVAEQACRLGVGKTFHGAIGAKTDHRFNSPVVVRGDIVYVGEPSFVLRDTAFSGIDVYLGRSTVLQVGNIFILVTSQRTWTHDPELFRCVKLPPENAGIIVVKSPLMYRTAYAPIASTMITVRGIGASPSDFTCLPYRKVSRRLFPFDMNCPGYLSES